MKTSSKIILISLFALSLFASEQSFAAKYAKKKPPISQMMLGNTGEPKIDPKPDAKSDPAPAVSNDAQPAKESEKK